MEPILASFGTALAGIIFLVICVLLMGIILIQKGRGGGLGGAFGGAGGHSAFGAKTGDVFTWITVVLASLFIVLAALLTRFVFTPKILETPTATITAPGATGQPQATPTDEQAPVETALPASDEAVQPEDMALPDGEQAPADQ